MDLIAYVHDSWRPLIRAARPERDWMDASPEKYAYRCLPLTVANTHGWELISPVTVRARWNGGPRPSDVEVQIVEGDRHSSVNPTPLFGLGTFTFHVPALFRTPPSTSLWVRGSPNWFKMGLHGLDGIVETEWLQFTFTMNWKITVTNMWVTIAMGEPFCFFHPVRLADIQSINPRFVPMSEAPEVAAELTRWNDSRSQFQAEVQRREPFLRPDEKWQKNYMRGVDLDGVKQPNHIIKLRLPEFK